MAKKLISYDDTLPGTGLPAEVAAKLIHSTAPPQPDIFGPEIVTPSGWTLGAGWSGTASTGFTYDGSGGGTLAWATPDLLPSTFYVVSFTVDGFDANNNFPGDLGVEVAGVDVGPIYKAVGLTVQDYAKGFMRSVEGGPLVFTPKQGTPMKIVNVSIKQVTGAFLATSVWRDASGTSAAELRTTGESSLFIGDRSGRRHMGTDSVGVGTGALENDLTGFFNVAVGKNALQVSMRTSRNSAVGYQSLSRNGSGPRNTAMGSFSGYGIRSGKENIAIGVDAMFGADGDQNTAVGVYAIANATNPLQNVAVGHSALRYTNGGENNVAVGNSALLNSGAGSDNVAIGHAALFNAGGSGNAFVGGRSGFNNKGSYNVTMGERALYGASGSTASQNVTLGVRAGQFVSTAERNVMIGYESGIAATTGHRNTLVGTRAGLELTTGHSNVVIGNESGSGLVTGARNVLIRAGMEGGFTNDFLNIGSTIYGNLATKSIGIGVASPSARIHIAAATGGQGEAPIRIDPGVLVPSPRSGNIEFDGTDLYFTIANVRRKVALVTEE